MADKSSPPKVLDADVLIDEILAKKGPQKYTHGLSEDNWEEELEQIPLFMSKQPDGVNPEKAPGLAALQDLKYQLQTAEGRATAHKEEGNEHFRKKKYKEAIEEYTSAIKEKCEDAALNAILYTNRAAAQFHLANYRSSLMDTTQAKKLNPTHMKAILRGALSCMKMHRYGEAIVWCDDGLRIDAQDSKLKEIRSKATQEKKRHERDERKKAAVEKTKQKEKETLIQAIKSRGIQLAATMSLDPDDDKRELNKVEFNLTGPHPSGTTVSMDTDGCLVWPVLFLYPEYGQTDFISAFNENQRFSNHIAMMFGSEPPVWDKDHTYTTQAVEVYYEDSFTSKLISVATDSTLARVLSTKGYTVNSGTPTFIILAARTTFRKDMIERQTQTTSS